MSAVPITADVAELIELAVRARPGEKPWLGGTPDAPEYLLLVPMWDGTFSSERAVVEGKPRSLGEALAAHAARFASQPTVEFAWGALFGLTPRRFALPIEPLMDELKESCDRGELLVGLARQGAPRVFRFAAFEEVYEVTLELPGGERVVCPWRDWAAGLEVLFSMP